jgi:hypothetical protein
VPYSYSQFTADGTNRVFAVSFPYILRAHVRLLVNYNPATKTFTSEVLPTSGFTWLSGTSVQTVSTLAAGTALTVVRQTPINARLVDWQSGSPPTSDNLDTADLQVYYTAQETLDLVEASIGIVGSGSWSTGSGSTLYSTAPWTDSDLQIATTKSITQRFTQLGTPADGTVTDAKVAISAGIQSSKLSFLQAGTGALARTVQVKLQDVVSVRDFGAVADGNFATGAGTDNTAAFQAAINSLTLPGNGGRSLYVPAGVYKLVSQITVPSGLSIIGDGMWNSVLFCPSAFGNTGGLVRCNGTGGPPTIISKLGVLAQTGGASGWGLVTVANGTFIDTVWVNGFAVGIHLASTDVFLTNFAAELSGTNVYITESDINVSHGTVYGGTQGVVVNNNASTGNGRLHLSNVRASSCDQTGFYVGTSKNVNIADCSASHVNLGKLTVAALKIESATDVVVNGFNGSISGTASTTSQGIYALSSLRVVITGCTTTGFLDGIIVNASDDVVIDGNLSQLNGRYGIAAFAGRVAITGNVSRTNGTAAANDTGISSTNSSAGGLHSIVGNISTNVAAGAQDYGIAASITNSTAFTVIEGNLCTGNNVSDIYLEGANSGNFKYGPNLGTIITDVTAPSVASAATLTLPRGADVVSVTGTTGITSIVATGNARRTATLIFAGALTVTDGSNLKLAGNFTTTADDVLTLYCDGTNWFEVSRSVN